ncbi:collagen alpha-1(I) chain-like [Patiria miniata]|uniref:Uncharacterized protein n=1 Tax=Patiria miniata TaxID=46514 RepID=A0A914B622_PATMI|nr:collagen alpha-1(I) chain-like [Patiria miniata]
MPARVGRVRPDIPPGPGTHGNQTARAGGGESGSPGPLAPRPPGGTTDHARRTPAAGGSRRGAEPQPRRRNGRRAAARRAADRGGPPPRGDPADRGIETRGVRGRGRRAGKSGPARDGPGRQREPNGPCGEELVLISKLQVSVLVSVSASRNGFVFYPRDPSTTHN